MKEGKFVRRGSFGAWRASILGLGIALVGAGGWALPIEADGTTNGGGVPVRVVRDLAYHEGTDADAVRHKLDLYLPKDRTNYPVVLFVHGGAWSRGDKNQLGIYAALGRCFARHGIGLVAPNYRLSPTVTHPGHITDVARAFAWMCKHLPKYGARPDEFFVSGHSAGGHLAALLATDDTYLKAQGMTLQAIRGALPLSGVFRIPSADTYFVPMFGADPAVRKLASPLSHARPDAPPFLIICAENDLPNCDRPDAEAFCRALQEKNCAAAFLEAPRRNHVSILWNATLENDPVSLAMMGFIIGQTVTDRLASGEPGAIGLLRDFIGTFAGR